MGNNRLGRWWLAGAAGLLAGLALPPLGLPPLLWLALLPLWALPGLAHGVWGGALWGAAAVLVRMVVVLAYQLPKLLVQAGRLTQVVVAVALITM